MLSSRETDAFYLFLLKYRLLVIFLGCLLLDSDEVPLSKLRLFCKYLLKSRIIAQKMQYNFVIFLVLHQTELRFTCVFQIALRNASVGEPGCAVDRYCFLLTASFPFQRVLFSSPNNGKRYWS